MRIGFIGAGRMGRPMIRNLIRAGYDLAVYDRISGKLDELVALGAVAPGSSQAVAERSDVVITSLVDWSATREVVFGPHGVLAGIRHGSLFIDMGTESPRDAFELADAFEKRGVESLDAGVSGGEQGAHDGTLAIMVGGSEIAFERALPVFAPLGKATLIGETGAGQIAKLCNQVIVAGTIELVAEAFALARAYGVDPAVVREAIRGGFAESKILEAHGQRMLERNFKPGGAMRGHMKDREHLLEACTETGLDLPAAKAAFERVKAVVDHGGGELDHSALYTLYDDVRERPELHRKEPALV